MMLRLALSLLLFFSAGGALAQAKAVTYVEILGKTLREPIEARHYPEKA